MVEEEQNKEEAVGPVEDKLELVRARISSKLDKIRGTAALVSVQRKELGRRRKKAMENVILASDRYKELERQLEEACEAEDFERAERVSESLAEKEKEKDRLLGELRDVELDCDAVDSKMQDVLESQIAAEEEGAALLEQFAKDATDHADLVLRRAEEISSKQIGEWESSMQLLEINKMEMGIESQLVSEARSGLENSIEHLVEDDRKEVELLRTKQGIFSEELDQLLALVRLKEAEIAENDSQIQKVEKKISDVISDFHETQENIKMKHENLQLSLSKLESEHEALSTKKKEIDEFILQAQQKSSSLQELASVSLDEVRTCQNWVGLRKSLASSILKSREDKVKFAKIEERILEEIQILRQQISSARTTLQELSSNRVSIQQEIASYNQRIGFIEKRGPELEAEKKIAAAARNFKEAGRIAAEAKALNMEKESLETKIEKSVLDLKKLEGDIKDTVDKIQEDEGLILLKEKEAAMAGCKRLRLVAASARAERSAALEMGDEEEGDSLLKEAEAADSKARELQETYDLEPEDIGNALEHSVSISLITNLAGEQLAKMASSLNLSTNVES
ncbi:uncharacterized protein A4U43_C05F16210 [Asparagus officinalis]|uniref:UVR domain-containing protein n=1 Tax=Asparagus officinalis TaxID=4686 RepID=A0A5P1ERY8_ASPOF|nr:cingulin [Asparagus officinalis]ONK68805.1 uncharacterized protein A4U43_C05F16210 [Asparagus officinalis]